MDWFVVLGPLLALGVVALLGFAGCRQILGIEEPTFLSLTLSARVSTILTVTRAEFSWLAPGATVFQRDEDLDVRVDGPEAETVLERTLLSRAEGIWEVTCTIEARLGTALDEATATATFLLDATNRDLGVALFRASGSPEAGTFTVTFVGLTD